MDSFCKFEMKTKSSFEMRRDCSFGMDSLCSFEMRHGCRTFRIQLISPFVYSQLIKMIRPGKIVVLEGLPGIGKTTLGESLQAHDSNVVFIPEVVNVERLKIYLADMQNKAADFQFDTQFETAVRLRQAAKYARAGRDVIVDRGLGGNLCFALIQHEAGMISDERMDEYRATFSYDKIAELEGIEVRIVYMFADAEFCLQRIRSRGRAGEDTYRLDYLERLKAKHDELLGDSVIVTCDGDTQFTSSGHLPQSYVEALMVL